MSPSRRRRIAALLAALFALLLVATASRVWGYRATEREARRSALERALEETRRAAAAVERSLQRVVPVVHELTQRLSAGHAVGADAEALLVDATLRLPELVGIGILQRPDAGSAGPRPASPYHLRSDPLRGGGEARVERTSAEERVDFTRFGVRRFTDTLLDGPTWVAPDRSGLAGRPTASYSEPFLLDGASGPEPAGVVTADVSLAWVAEQVDEFGLGRFGYGFLLAQDGSFVSHPQRSLVDEGETIFERAWATEDPDLHAVGIRAMQGEAAFLERRDPATGQSTWVFVEPVPTAGWSMVAVFIEDELRAAPEAERRALISISLLALGCFLVGCAALTVGFGSGSTVSLWVASFGVTALLLAAIVIVCSLAFRHSEALTPGGIRILDRNALELFVDATASDGDRALRVPTGVFLSSVELPAANLARVRGYVWQRYGPELPASVTRGFLLPQAEVATKQVAYRGESGGVELVGWEFSADLRQSFQYHKYPFDRQRIRLQIQPADFEGRVVLVPDLDAYGITNPRARPGLGDELGLPGWRILESYFDFHERDYNTSFGIEGFARGARLELEFNVELQREFLGPFISDLIPVLVATAMLFGMLVAGTQREDRVKSSGFSSLRLLGASSALFFVIVFQHIALRRELASPSLVYVEYFHFAAYAMILLVSVNGILFAMGGSSRIVHHEDNLVPKLCFWPFLLAFLLAVTLRTFY